MKRSRLFLWRNGGHSDRRSPHPILYKWEDAKVAPRPAMLPKIAAVLRMGKREALRTLAEMQGA